MNKRTWFSGMAAAAVVALGLVGCGSSNPLIGTWKFDKVDGGGMGSLVNSMLPQHARQSTVKITASTFTMNDGGTSKSAPITKFKVDSKDHVVTYYVKKGGTVTGIKAHMIDNNHEFYIAVNPGYGGEIRMYYQRKG